MKKVFTEQENIIIESHGYLEKYAISELANMKSGDKLIIDSWYSDDGQRFLYKFGIEVLHKEYPNIIIKYFSGYYDDERETEIYKIDLEKGQSLGRVYTMLEKPLLSFYCHSGEFLLYKKDLCEKPVGGAWSILTDFPMGKKLVVNYTVITRDSNGVLIERKEPEEVGSRVDLYWVQYA